MKIGAVYEYKLIGKGRLLTFLVLTKDNRGRFRVLPLDELTTEIFINWTNEMMNSSDDLNVVYKSSDMARRSVRIV